MDPERLFIWIVLQSNFRFSKEMPIKETVWSIRVSGISLFDFLRISFKTLNAEVNHDKLKQVMKFWIFVESIQGNFCEDPPVPGNDSGLFIEGSVPYRIPFGHEVLYRCPPYENFVSDVSRDSVILKCLDSPEGIYDRGLNNCTLSRIVS